ncbi:sigma-54-dependent Fis family transcriptional regulator [Rhizobium cremeum]|uniref:sigma-54-dependent transcriptional regulator n=1 Tax=Rhizobium cremeum TaxID=2813827 RepID=UPI000DDCB4BC|nr:sigma-54 dependent transcriptional regulator [Rhizobium cremeum]MCJ7995481.1 sigma-54-dependent Fis family transcriptional regulator [Rhizobium cremeum]MCJ8000979.1 sigma-54-dependent Fis family transcriptional regulator [Rhizobium cremeum]
MNAAPVLPALVLLVEDDHTLRQSMAQWLELNDLRVIEASNAKEALKMLSAEKPDVVLSDVRMRGMSGLELLDAIKASHPTLPVIILSGHGDVPMAVAAMQGGAFTFLTKPYLPDQLIATLRNAVESSSLRRKVAAYERSNEIEALIERHLIGEDQSTARLKSAIARLAALPVDVLILGETGTGKEVVARLLHDGSSRRDKPFVALNCAALPADIIESELFGHEAGAFTGASGSRLGKFEYANGGTVFLDEVESMPAAAQAKLLRVLQERTVTRLGSNKDIRIDIRVVSATKESLKNLSAGGGFREDLYYRLMGAEISIPPLRERGHDAIVLFSHFTAAMASRLGVPNRPLTGEEMERILSYPWPGNVRELKLLAERRALDLDWAPEGAAKHGHDVPGTSLAEQMDTFELRVLKNALATAGNSADAARLLSLPLRTFNEKIQRLSRRART